MRTCTPGFTNSVNRWVHCRPVIVEGKNANEHSLQGTITGKQGNGLIFLACVASKVTAMPRNRQQRAGHNSV